MGRRGKAWGGVGRRVFVVPCFLVISRGEVVLCPLVVVVEGCGGGEVSDWCLDEGGGVRGREESGGVEEWRSGGVEEWRSEE